MTSEQRAAIRLRLIREPSIDGATLGCLFLNGHFACFTLEDEIREVEDRDVLAWKVPGRTAIPAGTYPVAITPSTRFKRRMPSVIGVPGFSGIRIHPGNTIEDTEGCIVVGRDRQRRRVLQSRVAFEALFERLEHSGACEIHIENPEA